LNEKNSITEIKRIKHTDIVTAKHLAISYKPRNVAIDVEKCELGSSSEHFDVLIGQTELGYIALYSNQADATSIFYVPKGLKRKLHLIITLKRKVKTFI
jgi:hypothetical protein